MLPDEKEPPQDDEDEQARADFEAGAGIEPAAKPPKKAEPEVEPEPKELEPPKVEHVQLTKEQYERLERAAHKADSLEQQMSKAFGTIGNVQKVINELQAATPRGIKVDIPKDAFDEMAKDFPELAQHTRAALERSLRGITGTAPANADFNPEQLLKQLRADLEKDRAEKEMRDLDDDHPDWRTTISLGPPGVHDPNSPFRKWLATRDAAYQERINGTESAAVLRRALDVFKRENRPAPKQTPANPQQARNTRIADAVKPRGDGGHATATRAENDDFEAGYAGR